MDYKIFAQALFCFISVVFLGVSFITQGLDWIMLDWGEAGRMLIFIYGLTSLGLSFALSKNTKW